MQTIRFCTSSLSHNQFEVKSKSRRTSRNAVRLQGLRPDPPCRPFDEKKNRCLFCCVSIAVCLAARELFEFSEKLTRQENTKAFCCDIRRFVLPKNEEGKPKGAVVVSGNGALDLKYSTAFRHVWTEVESTRRFRD